MEKDYYKSDRYLRKKSEILMITFTTTVSNEELRKVNETKSKHHKKELKNRQEWWQSKALHSQYPKDINSKTDNGITRSWLQKTVN